MTILTVNAGSSSVRLAAFVIQDSTGAPVAKKHFDICEDSPESMLGAFLEGSNIKEVSAVAHRVVHGGTKFVKSCIIDAGVEAEIQRLSALAPLHNPAALKWIRICRDYFGSTIPQTAVFDTAYYSGMPEVAATYALPEAFSKKHDIRRYGFHGLAHSSMQQRWQEIRPDIKNGGRTISLQLGAGCSMTAAKYGKVMDTSMGFSPLEGLVMATRSGDIDPGLITYLIGTAGFTRNEIERLLNNNSGLLGLSGLSSDMRVLLESERPEARLAINLYCYRAMKYIGAYLSVLEGADGIIFGGGVGENAPLIRDNILRSMKWCGILIDSQANNDTIGREGRISSPESRTDVWVIPVDEASVLAQEAAAVLNL